MLKSSSRRDTLRLNWASPLKSIKIQYQQIIEPKFAITTSENEHVVFNNTGGMKLSHGSFTSDDAGNVEAEFLYTFFQINENDIGQHLKPIPTTVDNDLRAVPDLRGVAHSRLWKLMLVHFRLRPSLFF
jgi:hypothetical protein